MAMDNDFCKNRPLRNLWLAFCPPKWITQFEEEIDRGDCCSRKEGASHDVAFRCILHPRVIRVNFVNVLRSKKLVLNKDSWRHGSPAKDIRGQLNNPDTIRLREIRHRADQSTKWSPHLFPS